MQTGLLRFGERTERVDVFLKAGQVLKSLNQRSIERDREGNPILWVEASNPNPDIENEKLYAQTLMNAENYFLNYGSITYDHLPKNYPETGSMGYIGKPLEVQKEGKSVWVKCKLNRLNPIVKDILQKIEAGIEFVVNLRASIGGRFSRRSVDVVSSDGAKILQGNFLWDELALTYIPVNDTLQGIQIDGKTLRKSNTSYSSPAFLLKSLQATGLTNLSTATGADALTLPSPGIGKSLILQLQQLIRDGTINNKKEVVEFLKASGLSEKQIKKVFLKGGKMFGKGKKGIKKKTAEILKSLNKGGPPEKSGGDTLQSLAQEFSGGNPEIAQYLEEILMREGKGKTPEELRALAMQVAEEEGLEQDESGGDDSENSEDDGNDEDDVKKSGSEDWANTVTVIGTELGIAEMQETIKSLSKKNDELTSALEELCEVVGEIGEGVEKSLARPAAQAAAVERLRTRAGTQESNQESNDDRTLVQKSLNKHFRGEKFRGGTNEADELLSSFHQHVIRGGSLDNNTRSELQEYLGGKS